jgi:hypothetical protein
LLIAGMSKSQPNRRVQLEMMPNWTNGETYTTKFLRSHCCYHGSVQTISHKQRIIPKKSSNAVDQRN